MKAYKSCFFFFVNYESCQKMFRDHDTRFEREKKTKNKYDFIHLKFLGHFLKKKNRFIYLLIYFYI